ncbi:MAG TPA: bis-aminopropyl spermidine synthase family protein, partial [Streptosporangiaceae bacterium]|nr:bis-aminopropyl spermidine synthase family protein [Streptosporangiaceae bacterium]
MRELKASFGIDARRIDAVGCLLTDGEFRSVAELVSLTGTSRRTAEAVLRAAERHLDASAGRVRISEPYAAAYAAEFGCAADEPVSDPWDRLARRDPVVLAEATGLVEHAPAAQRDLDQVPATPVTVLKRGHYLRRSFDLHGAHVLCVGDHDLTSLGLFLAGGADGLRVSVVDADEALLGYIDAEARQRCFDVRCFAADLRLGLPPALLESSQLIFTDPPYTPEGVRLFVARGLQGLADTRNGRVLVAYGFGEQPALGLAVQQALSPLHLAYEAVLPGFSRYAGAEAIGGEAALYVLRPTRRSRSAAQAGAADEARAGLYTGGAQSVESAPRGLGEAAAAAILGLVADPGEPVLLVGPGWPEAAGGGARRGNAGGGARRGNAGGDEPAGAGQGERLPLSALMAAPLPRSLQNRTAVINLYPGFGSLVFRVLLAASARRLAIVCRNGVPELRDAAGQRALARLIAPKYRITRLLRSAPEPDMAVILAERASASELTAAEQVAGYIYARAHGKLGNAWREGLIALWASRGQ